MSLHELPESSSTPRRSILPQGLVMTMAALALAACDRVETVESSPSPARAPTGAIVETLTDTTLATRHALAREVSEEALRTTGGGSYTRRFPLDPEHPTDWHLHQIDVGFGPQGGIHVVVVKKEPKRTYVIDMLDAEGDGRVDFVESTTSWLVKTEGTETPMVRSEKYYTVSNRIFDHFASALQQFLRLLAKEKKTQNGE